MLGAGVPVRPRGNDDDRVPIVASAACDHEPAALLGGLETDSTVTIQVPSLNRASVTGAVSTDAIGAATVRRASRDDRSHGTAHLQGGSFAAALGNAGMPVGTTSMMPRKRAWDLPVAVLLLVGSLWV